MRLNFAIPEAFANSPPMITVRLNGETLERFQALSSDVSRDYHVNPLSSPNVMELSTDRTAPDGRAGRDLGLRVRFISWGPN